MKIRNAGKTYDIQNNKVLDIKDTDCRLPEGHRYDADGRCVWCDAESEDIPWPNGILSLQETNRRNAQRKSPR